MLQAGIVFGGVRVRVSPHKISVTTDQKSTQLGKNMPHGER